MKIYIKGTITLNDDDKTKVEFDLSNTESWNQWGNYESNLWDTMPVIETLEKALCNVYAHYDEEVA